MTVWINRISQLGVFAAILLVAGILGAEEAQVNWSRLPKMVHLKS